MKTYLLLGLIILTGCSTKKNSDVSNEPQNQGLIGKKFATKSPLLLFKYEKSNQEVELTQPGKDFLPDISEIPQTLPAEINGAHIYGVLPKGTVFQIASVMRSHSADTGDTDYNRIKVISTSDFDQLTISSGFLRDITGKFVYNPEYIEEKPDTTKTSNETPK